MKYSVIILLLTALFFFHCFPSTPPTNSPKFSQLQQGLWTPTASSSSFPDFLLFPNSTTLVLLLKNILTEPVSIDSTGKTWIAKNIELEVLDIHQQDSIVVVYKKDTIQYVLSSTLPTYSEKAYQSLLKQLPYSTHSLPCLSSTPQAAALFYQHSLPENPAPNYPTYYPFILLDSLSATDISLEQYSKALYTYHFQGIIYWLLKANDGTTIAHYLVLESSVNNWKLLEVDKKETCFMTNIDTLPPFLDSLTMNLQKRFQDYSVNKN